MMDLCTLNLAAISTLIYIQIIISKLINDITTATIGSQNSTAPKNKKQNSSETEVKMGGFPMASVQLLFASLL